jgi:hypothetical protein
MNYQDFAQYNDRPPYYKQEHEGYYDRGQGVPQLTHTNMTVQDIYRTPFLLLQEHRKNYNNLATTAIKGIHSESGLARLFFSDANIKRVQRMIRREVFKRTQGKFRLEVDQELRNVLIAMRAIYLEHARFLPGETVKQIKRLNEKTVSEIVPGMLTEIRQEYGYLKEINKPLTPIPLPINVNNKGRLTLPSVTTTFGY